MRERDPAQGEVFTHIDPELLQQLEAAAEVLGREAEVPGMLANKPNALRGAAMLKSLAERYDMRVERRVIGGQGYLVVKGDLKPGAALEEQSDSQPGDLPVPQHVEVLVRERDLAVTRMDHMHEGKPFLTIEIGELQVGVPLSPKDFRIELPAHERFIPILEHPPAAAQIKRLLDEADARREAGGRGEAGGQGGANEAKSGK